MNNQHYFSPFSRNYQSRLKSRDLGLERRAWQRYVAAVFLSAFLVLVGTVVAASITLPLFTAQAHADSGTPVSVWWPVASAPVSGTQPFKAMVPGMQVEQYDMYWQVDGGSLNYMYNSYQDYPHKEAVVDVSH